MSVGVTPWLGGVERAPARPADPVRRRLARLAVCVLLAAPTSAAAGPRLRGPEVIELAAGAINAVKMHQQAMAAQVALDEVPFFFELAARSAPVRFTRADQAVSDGGLSRYGLSMGGGGGTVRELAGFVGLQYDTVSGSRFPNLFEPAKGLDFNVGQLLLYAGGAAYGFQFSYGVYADPRLTGFDAAGEFEVPGDTGPAYGGIEQSRKLMTLNTAWGLHGDVTWVLDDEGERHLDAARVGLDLALLMRVLELDDLGRPALGLERFASEVDYFGDRFEQRTELPEDDTYLVPLEFSDVLGTGVGLRAVTQVAPKPIFRLAELNWLYRVPGVVVEGVISDFAAGGRAQVFRRGREYRPSADAYLAMQADFYQYFSFFGAPWLALSYSYNSPDSGTFMALPDVHAIGIQLVYGPVEMARPLLPISPPARDLISGGH